MSSRSQSSDNSSIESDECDIQLVELFEIKIVEMSSLKLSYESGIKFISVYRGEKRELGCFIESCEYV